MSNQIQQAYDEAIASAETASEREALLDAKRVSEIVRRIASPSDRQAVVGVLERFDRLAEIADDVADGRIIPFPTRISSQTT